MDQTVAVADTSYFVRVEGEGSPLLLVHGFPLDHHMWDPVLPRLAEQHQVIAPDLRGFGQSGGHQELVPMERFADDLAALLEALNVTEQVTLCGLSMGGYIAWQMWKRHRDRLSRLVLMDTKAAADDETHARARRHNAEHVLAQGMEEVPGNMLPKLLAETTLENQPEVISQLQAMILRQDPRGVAAAQRGMAQRPDVNGWLSDISLPTLVVCGAEDKISPPDEMSAMAAQIPGAQFVKIAGSGHLPPIENPDAVCDALLPFSRDID